MGVGIRVGLAVGTGGWLPLYHGLGRVCLGLGWVVAVSFEEILLKNP
jgi:hypothetical protein